ncbi:hypothetical protein FAZ95_36450 [Trinickia violacea]|uniref:Uncharacterized protein n=1 Tax=Trinickia violacea TaxID=2571746 RepID=A0A4P8J0W8_9BURK|nr:hypothetical protein [Trinickia violacea]QCP54417.1 hypothetical protein FAZ95_36450 [Trinickia violacea]
MTRARTEELRLVFALRDAVNWKDIELIRGAVSLQPRGAAIDCLEALQLIINVMRRLEIDTTFLELGATVSAEAILRKVALRGTWAHLETTDLSFQYEVVSPREHAFIVVREIQGGAAGKWEQWVKSFLPLHGFVQAWVSDVQYGHWQNVRDPLEYEIAGRSCSHLAMESNELPPPYERTVIDISENPGHWESRRGYVEAIGATMWLSDLFWARVGPNSRARVHSAEWLRVSGLVSGVTEIQVSDDCFAGEDTASLQWKLRALIYG